MDPYLRRPARAVALMVTVLAQTTLAPTLGGTGPPTPSPAGVACYQDVDCDPGLVCSPVGHCVAFPTRTPTIPCAGDADCPDFLLCFDGSCRDHLHATPTPTPPTAEATPTSSHPASCHGDCDGDGRVSVAELITGVNILLGSQGLFRCPILDSVMDSRVTVPELVDAVTSAVNGCPH